MIEILPESQGNVLAIRGTERLTASDYEELLIPRLEAIIRKHRKSRLLFLMDPDFKGWDFDAAKLYANFGLKHRNDFERVAGVCGPKWVNWGMKLQSLFSRSEIRTFSCDEAPSAMQWIGS